jgi:DNA primase
MVSQSESEVVRTGFMAECANYMRLPLASLQRDFQAFAHRQARVGPPAAPASPATAPIARSNRPPEDDLLLLCLHFEQLGKPLAQAILAHDWINSAVPSGRILWRFLTEFEHDVWPGRDHLDELLESPEEKALVASLLFEAPAIDDPRKAANEGLRRLHTRALEPRLRQIELEIAAKQTDVDPAALSLLWKERSEFQRLLRQPPVLPAVG